jgi:hypothetical protein
MATIVGLWIDHRKAVIVAISELGETTKEIDSDAERQPGRMAGVRSTVPYESQYVRADDVRERKFSARLRNYYEEVVAAVRDAESILIFGPGEAKGELEKRLRLHRLGERVTAVQTVDRMTDREIAAKVREYFRV